MDVQQGICKCSSFNFRAVTAIGIAHSRLTNLLMYNIKLKSGWKDSLGERAFCDRRARMAEPMSLVRQGPR